MIERLSDLIGAPWAAGAMGPAAFDCWGMAREVQHRLFERTMPAIEGPPTDPRALMRFVRDHTARAQWRQVSAPTHGCLVEMGQARNPFHIGVWLDVGGGSIIHSQERVGCTFDRLVALRAIGWHRITFHDWLG